MAEPETTNTVMLDQAEVDAAEAAQDAQDNGGDDNQYIGRRPSSSGRETKRYRKCLPAFLRASPPAPPSRLQRSG